MIEIVVVCPSCGATVRQVAVAVPSEVAIPCRCGMAVEVDLVPLPQAPPGFAPVTVGDVRPFDWRAALGERADDA